MEQVASMWNNERNELRAANEEQIVVLLIDHTTMYENNSEKLK